MPSQLPEYDQPPLDEVAIGLQFEALQKFKVAHFGLYWDRIRDRYPLTESHPPLAHAVEPPSIKPASSRTLTISSEEEFPAPRCWFLGQSQTELIQLQTDRF